MEQNGVGRVLTEATIENLKDLWAVREGRLAPDKVRRVTVHDALVDTGCTTLALPVRLIRQLGLSKQYDKRTRAVTGPATVAVYDAVRLTIQDRYFSVDPMEVPDDVPVLIGQIPLEMLDLVVDVQGRQLTGNPAHGGEQVLELY
jgi:predicted aspartyl protease